MEPITTALPTSDPMRIGRRGSRSTHAPMNNPTTSDGAIRNATSRPVSVAPAPRTSTAVSGRASTVTWLPTTAIVNPAQSLEKSEPGPSARPGDAII